MLIRSVFLIFVRDQQNTTTEGAGLLFTEKKTDSFCIYREQSDRLQPL